jgi:hypothetical protein
MTPQVPQIPSRQSWSKATGSSPCITRRSLRTSSISRNDISGFDAVDLIGLEAAGGVGTVLLPDLQGDVDRAGFAHL